MRKQKQLSKTQLARMSEDYRVHNKRAKQNNQHTLCFPTFEDYLDWRFGRTSVVTPSRSSKSRALHPARVREDQVGAKVVPSRLMKELESGSDLKNATARPGSNSYSGTYIVGIATMHKSNLVPVGSGDNPEDYSTMRRSN